MILKTLLSMQSKDELRLPRVSGLPSDFGKGLRPLDQKALTVLAMQVARPHYGILSAQHRPSG